MTYTIHKGDALTVLRTLPDASVECCVTSPPYFGLRDYGVAGQMGLEPTPQEYVDGMVAVFREVRRVLRGDGTLWLNLGDSYAGSGKGGNPDDSPHKKQRTNAGSMTMVGQTARDAARTRGAGDDRLFGLKPKDLIGIPWRVAFALQADGWYLRQDIIWHKPNPMPESVTDRCTKSHEYVFLLSKSARYWYDAKAVSEAANPACASRYDSAFGGKKTDAIQATGFGNTRPTGQRAFTGLANRRDVWTIPTQPCKLAHFAVMPLALATPCILAGCPEGGTVLDPFAGAGTTILAALQHDRRAVGIELNPANVAMIHDRVQDAMGLLLTAHAEGGE